MKRFSIVLSILMFQAAMALPALAQDSSDEFKPGAYVQGQFAAQFLTGDASDVFKSGGFDTGFYGGGIAAGYFLTNWLALQARANFISNGSVGGVSLDSLTAIYTVDAKLYVLNLFMRDANGLLQPYAIAGLGGYSIVGTNTNLPFNADTYFTFELGAGLDLMLTNHFGLFGEFNWQYVDTGPILNTNVNSPNNIGINIGATYRF